MEREHRRSQMVFAMTKRNTNNTLKHRESSGYVIKFNRGKRFSFCRPTSKSSGIVSLFGGRLCAGDVPTNDRLSNVFVTRLLPGNGDTEPLVTHCVSLRVFSVPAVGVRHHTTAHTHHFPRQQQRRTPAPGISIIRRPGDALEPRPPVKCNRSAFPAIMTNRPATSRPSKNQGFCERKQKMVWVPLAS